MTLAVQGRTLPANFAAYPVTVEGVEGYVLSISGHAAFFANAECDKIGRYLLFDADHDTEPVEIVQSSEVPARAPRLRG